jgi:8-oxo-dGTP pyrophosphatase MutT (NUDIX family)
MTIKIFKNAVALTLEFRGRLSRAEVERFTAKEITASAVLVLLVPSSQETPVLLKDYQILMTRRSDQLGHHRGQFAFPGGVCSPDELAVGCEGLIRTALRESYEEMGLRSDCVEVLGVLPSLITPTGFEMTPVVAVSQKNISELELSAHEKEIAEFFWISMDWLLEPQNHQREILEVEQKTYPIDVFHFEGRRIWGATGAVLKNWVERVRLAMRGENEI